MKRKWLTALFVYGDDDLAVESEDARTFNSSRSATEPRHMIVSGV